MKSAAELKREAIDGLTGHWGIAVGAGLVAGALIGGVSGASSSFSSFFTDFFDLTAYPRRKSHTFRKGSNEHFQANDVRQPLEILLPQSKFYRLDIAHCFNPRHRRYMT